MTQLYKYSNFKSGLKFLGKGAGGAATGIAIDIFSGTDPIDATINNTVTAVTTAFLSTALLGTITLSGLWIPLAGIALGVVVANAFALVSKDYGITPASLIRNSF